MTSNAGAWFFQEPEHNQYLISERLNSTFWTARVVDIYWKCVDAEPPFTAKGYMGNHTLQLEWQPNRWLRLTAPPSFPEDVLNNLLDAISKRVLGMDASLRYSDVDKNQLYEWHRTGFDERWNEVQGNPGYMDVHRL